MIKDRNIVCISSPPWESNYASTTVQLMKVMARTNRVLFVNNPFTLKDVIDGIRKKKPVPVKKVFGLKNRLKTVKLEQDREVYVLTPPMILPINFLPKGWLYDTILQLNGWMVRSSIRKYLKKLGMTQDLVSIVSLNPAIGLVTGRRLQESQLIYLCYDEISVATYIKKHGAWMEKAFARMVDGVIVTSQGLLERKSYLHPNLYLVKNAADIKLFSTGFTTDIHPRKRIGLVGAVDRRLDYPLLEYVIGSLPEVEFVFIGRTTNPAGEDILRRYPNVTLTGAKNINDIPQYLKTFSVGIIPFLKTEFNKGIYPLKINEYLAAGLPVVTTNFSYLSDFASVVRIAESKEEFLQYLVEEMQTDTAEKKLARQDLARQNSWESRGEDLSQVIEDLDRRKKQ